MQRIWNEEELKSMPEWTKYSLDTWLKKGEDNPLDTLMLGQEITAEFKKEWNVQDYMIAKEPKEETIKPNNMETKKLPLNNGTVLEVGKKYRLNGWEEGDFCTILAIDDNWLWIKMDGNNREQARTSEGWLPYTPPTPQKEWKTFLIETVSQKTKVPYRFFSQYESEENARLHHKTAASITEVKLNIEEVK